MSVVTLASNNNFIAQTWVLFLSVTNTFAVCSKMFVSFLTRHVIYSSGELSLKETRNLYFFVTSKNHRLRFVS